MADSILRLKVESKEYDDKLKRATEGLSRYVDGCRKVGGTLEVVEKETLEYIKALGNMGTVSTTATGKLSEMKKTFVELSSAYKQMSEAERQSDTGKALAASLDQLRGRIQDSKSQLDEINRSMGGSNGKFGEFGNILDTVGSKMGLSGSLTEMLTSKTALMTAGIGAATAAIGKSADMWAKYNSELAKQDQITTVTTGLKGDDSNRMTDTARALADTYEVDFREAINAANTLMTQFGKSGDEAMQLIKDGMQGMIAGDGPKMLQMIQQFAPAFRDAGISADQLIAIIHNSEGGIFTDANMNAIVMGIKNIRLMLKATSDALAKVGIDGNEMVRKLNDGSMTIFDALQQVSKSIDGVGAGSQAAGEVMQYVFGRQGVTAGTNLGKAIEGLNTNLAETKRQTGELGNAFAELQTANEKLNTAIREAFGYDGWEQMAKGIESKLITALATVIDKLGKIRKWFSDFTPGGQTDNIQSGEQKDMSRRLTYVRSGSNKKYWHQQNIDYYDQKVSEAQFKVSANKGDDSISKGIRQRAEADLQAWKNLRDEYMQKANSILSAPPKEVEPKKTVKTPTTDTTTKTKNVKSDALEGSIDAQTAKINELQKAWNAAADDDSRKRIKGQLEDAQLILDTLTGKVSVKRINIEVTTSDTLQKIEAIDGIHIDPKTLVVTADTSEALAKIQDLDGLNIDTKKLPVDLSVKYGVTKDPTLEDTERVNRKGSLNLTLDKDTMDAVTKSIADLYQSGKNNKRFDKSIDNLSKGVGGFQSILGGLEHVGVEIPKEIQTFVSVMQGAMSIIQGVQALISLTEVPATVANTTALTALTAAMWANTFTPSFFANGGLVHAANGFVDGTTYSGDQIPAMLNAGELVLNRAQQAVLASQLQNTGMNGKMGVSSVSGEQIYVALSAYLKRTGKGENVKWK